MGFTNSIQIPGGCVIVEVNRRAASDKRGTHQDWRDVQLVASVSYKLFTCMEKCTLMVLRISQSIIVAALTIWCGAFDSTTSVQPQLWNSRLALVHMWLLQVAFCACSVLTLMS